MPAYHKPLLTESPYVILTCNVFVENNHSWLEAVKRYKN